MLGKSQGSIMEPIDSPPTASASPQNSRKTSAECRRADAESLKQRLLCIDELNISGYLPVMTNIANWKMAIEIVDFPIESGDFP